MSLSKWIASAAVGAFASIAAAAPALAEEATGRWSGQLPAPVGLHIVLTIEKGANGRYAGSLTSPDQSGKPIPATAVEATGDRLTFTQRDLGLVYEARWDEAKKAWVGVFTQAGHALALELKRDEGRAGPNLDRSPLLPPAPGLEGDWSGALDLGAQKLRLVLHVADQATGVKAGMDSLDQGASGIPITALTRSGDAVSFEIASFQAAFKGVLTDGGQSLVGTFTQGGQALPLKLTRAPFGSVVAKSRRPQEEAIAAAAVPYREASVDFDGPTTGVRLAGTLTLPKGRGPFPAVVLVSGSGRHTRDEDVENHKIFLVLADHLTRQGLAVLRYDKRGVGQSKGDYAAATTADFAADAEAAVAYLRSRPDIDGRRVGLVGHSEGGLIAPMVAAKDPGLAFIVMMAGPGEPGRVLLPEQERLINVASGQPQAEADMTYAIKRKLYDAIAASKDADEAKAKAREILSADPKQPQHVADEVVKLAGSAWMRFFLAHDPVPTLRQVRTPVLAMIGQKDLQVPASTNLPPIREALAAGGDVTVREMAGLNHLFQHATTGSPMEYGRIEETLAPELLQTVADWIAAHVK